MYTGVRPLAANAFWTTRLLWKDTLLSNAWVWVMRGREVMKAATCSTALQHLPTHYSTATDCKHQCVLVMAPLVQGNVQAAALPGIAHPRLGVEVQARLIYRDKGVGMHGLCGSTECPPG